MEFGYFESNISQNNRIDMGIQKNTVSSKLLGVSLHNGNFKNETFRANYTFKPDTPGQKLEVMTDMNFIRSKEKADYNNQYSDNQGVPTRSNTLRSFGNKRYNIFSFRADYTNPLTWAKIEMGGRYSRVDNQNKISFESLQNGRYRIDPERSETIVLRWITFIQPPRWASLEKMEIYSFTSYSTSY